MQSFIQTSCNDEDILTEMKLRNPFFKVLFHPIIHWRESAEVSDSLESILQFILPKYVEIPVLILAGIELVFFIVAGMGLRFGFVLKSFNNAGMF